MCITASLVLYHNDPRDYELAVRSFLDGCDGTIYVVDNSRQPLESELFQQPRVDYFFSGRNLGFGAGHNLAISRLPSTSKAHVLINPDICFEADVLPYLLRRLEEDEEIGVLMPRVVYPNGDLQLLCKLLPTPINLIFRRFLPSEYARNWINHRYELHRLPQDRPSDIPSLSGCFLIIRTSLLAKVGGFDEKYFMYMEDVDLVRRIGDFSRTVYDPSVSVIHHYEKGSYKNYKLLKYHLKSAIIYFNKWGWIFDRTRKTRNATALRNIST